MLLLYQLRKPYDMHTIRIADTTIKLPNSWLELTSTQAIIALRCKYADRLTNFQKQYTFLKAIVNNKEAKALRKVSQIQLAQIVDCLDWLNKPVPTTPLFLYFDFEGTRYYGAAELMKTSCVAEFVNCDNALMSHETDLDYLEKITAFIFRPKDEAKQYGDVREKMNTDKTLHTAKLFKNLPEEYKIYSLVFFLEVKQWVANAYAEAFEGEEDETVGQAGWAMTLMSVAESNVFGNLDSVKFTNLHEVLTFLVKKKREYYNSKQQQQRRAI